MTVNELTPEWVLPLDWACVFPSESEIADITSDLARRVQSTVKRLEGEPVQAG